jgi:bifunctional enzyme CysN/CysC
LLEARQECEFDAEHGTLLRFASFRDGQLVQSSEAVRIDYGCRIDPGRFVYADPRVEPAVPTGNAHAQRRTGSREGTGLRASTAIAPTLWLTGLPASGRTTLAHAVEAELARLSIAACVLDSDKIGDGLSSDLGGSESDRAEESRRTAHVASIVARTGAVAIVAAATPLPGARERAREIHRAAGVRFVEVWIGTPAEVCAARAASRAYPPTSSCALDDFGPRAYELSGDPDLRVSGYGSPPDAAAREVVALLLRQPIEPG